MQRIGAIAIILLLTLWSGLVFAQNDSATPVPYVYRLKVSNCTFDPVDRRQTGFRVQGLVGIVTALHGVADCQSLTAVPDDGIPFTDLVITAVDVERDIALLSSPALVDHSLDGLVPSTLTAREMLTATLRVIGYPLGLDKQDADLIESVRAIESLDAVIPDPEEPTDFLKRRSPDINIDVLNLQAQLLPGHSGAPVLDQMNQIIAVGNGGLRGGTVGRSWAIPWQSVQLSSVEVDEVKEKLATLAAKNITALSFSSTYPSSPEITGTPATYMVRVVDMNQQPIANAEILLTHSAGYEIGMTDSEGFYTFHLPTNVSYVQSQIQVEAPGYPLYNRTLSNVLGKVGAEIVRLTTLRPTPSPVTSSFCEFAFRILDEASQQPIENADLTVTLGSRLTTGKTDSNGFYESKLSCPDPRNASVRLRITADGYAQHSETVPLVGEIKEIFLTQVSSPTPTRDTSVKSGLSYPACLLVGDWENKAQNSRLHIQWNETDQVFEGKIIQLGQLSFSGFSMNEVVYTAKLTRDPNIVAEEGKWRSSSSSFEWRSFQNNISYWTSEDEGIFYGTLKLIRINQPPSLDCRLADSSSSSSIPASLLTSPSDATTVPPYPACLLVGDWENKAQNSRLHIQWNETDQMFEGKITQLGQLSFSGFSMNEVVYTAKLTRDPNIVAEEGKWRSSSSSFEWRSFQNNISYWASEDEAAFYGTLKLIRINQLPLLDCRPPG